MQVEAPIVESPGRVVVRVHGGQPVNEAASRRIIRQHCEMLMKDEGAEVIVEFVGSGNVHGSFFETGFYIHKSCIAQASRGTLRTWEEPRFAKIGEPTRKLASGSQLIYVGAKARQIRPSSALSVQPSIRTKNGK